MLTKRVVNGVSSRPDTRNVSVTAIYSRCNAMLNEFLFHKHNMYLVGGCIQ